MFWYLLQYILLNNPLHIFHYFYSGQETKHSSDRGHSKNNAKKYFTSKNVVALRKLLPIFGHKQKERLKTYFNRLENINTYNC